jgi:integrase
MYHNGRGARRIGFSKETPQKRIVWPDSQQQRLSEVFLEFLNWQRSRGRSPRTLLEYQSVFWGLVEFLQCDPPLRELPAEVMAGFLRWLREEPIRRRPAWSLPREINSATVGDFLRRPGRRLPAGPPRSEQTIGRWYREADRFFRWAGLECPIEAEDRPNLALPPPLVPRRAEILAYWQQVLDGGWSCAAAVRRRVVLTQALVLLTGMRIGELLAAGRGDVEGHWLLLRPEIVKTRRPRLVYLSARALAIGSQLSVGSQFLSGWGKTANAWQALVRRCGPRPCAKVHQALRRIMATWLHRRDQVAEAAQLGHGSGVVMVHYLDVIRRLPRLLEKFRVPPLAGFDWPWQSGGLPAVPQAPPTRLYEEFRRLVSRRRL